MVRGLSHNVDALFSIRGRNALVTGASSGLGAHFAKCLVDHGAAVALAARRVDRLAAVAAHAPDRMHPVVIDVTDSASVDAAVRQAEAELGRIDILVNCSGVAAPASSLDLDEADWDRVLDTNLRGAWLVSRAFGRSRVAAGMPGVVINVASILALRVASHVSAYAAAKAGLVHLTRAMALELARYGIRVNAICPGYVETDLNRDFFASDAGQRMKRRLPTRLGQPDDFAGPLVFLASAASCHMTGAVLVVDGGHLLSTL